ncbi:MAG: hypothetical protein FJ304_04755 [Planctomycetes bacterium]|nr:hypothetical protein [Planctomycetota bacterium]
MTGWKDALEIAKWGWDSRAGVKPLLAKFRLWLRRSKVLVIGPGGTGKTTLARILSGQFDWLLDSSWAYRESVEVKKYKLRADPAVEVVAVPGQEHRRRSTWDGIGTDVSRGEYRGVIFVASNGFHTPIESSYKRNSHFEPERTRDAFWRKYTEAKRDDELACLRHLVPFLKACPLKLWLATLVTKQDLWRAQEPAVETWYREGEYGKLVTEVASHKGAMFRYEYHGCSLLIGNLVTASNEYLVKNAEGYDHRAQVESVRRVFEVIDGLHAWGNAK